MKDYEKRLMYLNNAHKQLKEKVKLSEDETNILDDFSEKANVHYNPLELPGLEKYVLFESKIMVISRKYDIDEEIGVIVDTWKREEDDN